MNEVSEYETLKSETQELYAVTKPVRFPALGEEVRFTAEGFNHIIFKRGRHERERESQIMRFKLLPRAIRLIAHANTFQEFEETTQNFSVKSRKRREMRSKAVLYWGVIAIFDGIGDEVIKYLPYAAFVSGDHDRFCVIFPESQFDIFSAGLHRKALENIFDLLPDIIHIDIQLEVS